MESEDDRCVAVYHVIQGGQEKYLLQKEKTEFMDAARSINEYMRSGSGIPFADTLKDSEEIDAERFRSAAEERMENTGRVAGAFEVDLDRGEITALKIFDGWAAYKLSDVCSAVGAAFDVENDDREKQWDLFLDGLDGKEVTQRTEEKLPLAQTALCVVDAREKTYLLLDRPLTFLDVADAVREHLRDPGQKIFGDAKRIGPERFQELVIGHVEEAGEVAGVYRVDLIGAVASALDADCGWRMFNLNDVCQAAQSAGLSESVPYEERREKFDQALQERAFSGVFPVTLDASRPLAESDFIPGDSIEEVDNLLNFYLHVNCDVDELFGTHVGTDASDDYLNMYANYNLDTGRVADYLDITLCRGDGVDIPMTYRLSESERSMLLTKMRDYCQHCGTPLDEWRERYLAEQKADAGPTIGIGQSM